VKTLYDLDLLGRDILFSHASSATPDDMRMIQEKNVSISCTPSTEIQMGLGAPLAFEGGLTGSTSLGCDSHSVVRGSMIEQMRVALLDGRWDRTQGYLNRGAYPRQEKPSVEDAFNLATVAGAKAIGKSEELGRLRVGYKADVLVWGGQSPSMVCAAKHNPLTAVVAHAGTSDIEYVIVGGVVRKREGNLVRLQVERLQKGTDDELSEKMEYVHDSVQESDTLGPALGRKLEWLDVARELEKSREGIEFRIKEAGIDTDRARDEVAALFGFNTSIVED
jgi:cytosine/adenosine deaminase-related metal-dependent hydrolase